MPTVLIHSLLHCGNLSFQSLKRDRYSRRRLCHLCGWAWATPHQSGLTACTPWDSTWQKGFLWHPLPSSAADWHFESVASPLGSLTKVKHVTRKTGKNSSFYRVFINFFGIKLVREETLHKNWVPKHLGWRECKDLYRVGIGYMDKLTIWKISKTL